jgi:hypothetical protein
MPAQLNIPDKVQVRLTYAEESIRASLEPYAAWVEEMVGVPLSETLTLEVDCNPGDAVAEELLRGLPVTSATKVRNGAWRDLVECWALPPAVSPRIAVSLQRERRPKIAPISVWELDWQDCPVALKLRGLGRRVVSLKVPLVFPPGDTPIVTNSPLRHWFIAHRDDAAKVLLLKQQVQGKTERYLETAYGQTRLQARYDWDTLVLDSTARRMVRTDFELFFEREEWFRQHNLPYRRGYLLWGPPGNGKSYAIRVMAAHPHIEPTSSFSLRGKSGSGSTIFLTAGAICCGDRRVTAKAMQSA